MRLHVVARDGITFKDSSAVVIPHFSDGEPEYGGLLAKDDETALANLAAQKRITGKAQEVYYLPTPTSRYAGALVLGCGEHAKFNAETLRRAAGAACGTLSAQRIDHVVLDATVRDALPVEAFVEGIMLGQYDFAVYKKAPDSPKVLVEEIVVVVPSADHIEDLRLGCGRTVLMCDNTNWARDLANLAPNELTPPALAGHAKRMAEAVGAECEILDVDQMRRLGMNALLQVGRGSSKEPKLIILRHKHPDAKQTIALVGKGITFDSGGISLKPGLNMHEMKYDMCGAAAVLGAFKTIVETKAHINLVCVVPTAENKTGADAARPGDIVKAYNGKSIEIHNTDAEGRLILADALSYTAEVYKPDAMVDAATLTGAALVALGHFAAPIMSTSDALAAQLGLAADVTGERIWPMPLWDDYCELMKGTHADLCNIGPPMQAGSVTAACFLKEFTGDTPWAHLDIAGTAWGVPNIPYWDKNHATGYGVRLLSQWILEELGRK